jgi:hypothetical protein
MALWGNLQWPRGGEGRRKGNKTKKEKKRKETCPRKVAHKNYMKENGV